jgi:hypothetical protein
VKRGEAQRLTVGWNFCTWFLLKVSEGAGAGEECGGEEGPRSSGEGGGSVEKG